MKRILIFILIGCSLYSCTGKPEKVPDKNYFPVLSFLRGQVNHVDTSLYRITKIEWNGASYDTSFVKREEFRSLAADFLSLPDITSDKLSADYSESSGFDDLLKNPYIAYTTDKPHEIRREEIVLSGDEDENGNIQVETVMVHQVKTSGNSTVEKNLVWESNKRFTVFTTIRTPDQPEDIKKLIVVWNDFPEAIE